MRFSIWPLGLLLLGNTLLASDGVLEINQACALNGGCFSGDTSNFPVTIDGTAGASYRLTSSLDLTSIPDTTAIDIDAPYITLDLNGFEIRGSITCTGSGASLVCDPSGTGDGVALSSNADYVSIRNGTIRNMKRHGIGASGDHLTVKDVRARNNARDGINGGLNSIAVNCIANQNGNDGFQFSPGSVIEQSVAFGNFADGIRIDGSNGVINNSTSRNNGGKGFEMGHSSRFGKNSSTGNVLPDECGGGICSELRRYYVTTEGFVGDQAPGACEDGFHFASLWEIFDTSALAYDTVLGRTNDDSGEGPVAVFGGWARTGGFVNPDLNCANWTVGDNSEDGYTVAPEGASGWLQDADKISPWGFAIGTCDNHFRVWCIEDL